jgi:hypothetical protein
MTKERQSPPAGPTPEAPITLDALAAQVSLLAEAVGRLTAAEQSPDIPHEAPTGEEVVDMAEHDDSIIVKAGSKTYFFDLKQTRDNKPISSWPRAATRAKARSASGSASLSSPRAPRHLAKPWPR